MPQPLSPGSNQGSVYGHLNAEIAIIVPGIFSELLSKKYIGVPGLNKIFENVRFAVSAFEKGLPSRVPMLATAPRHG